MFHHIVGHQLVIEQLVRAIANSALPRALLISGPAVSGKFTIAIEIARLLNCLGNGATDCHCSSCTAMHHLSHAGVVVAGNRYFSAEFGRANETMATHTDEQARWLFVFSVRKLVKRLDAQFFTHTNNQHQRKLIASVASIEECLQSIEAWEEAGEDGQRQLREWREKIAHEVAAVIALFPQHIAVGTMRAIRQWIYEPVDGALRILRKVVIIEQVEQLNEAAANAMLKAVEETPRQALIIFLTTHASSVLPTLRSRTRHCALHQRTAAQEYEIIRDVFRHESAQPLSLFEFIHSHSSFNRAIYDLAAQCVEAVEQRGTLYSMIRALDATTGDKRFSRQEINILIHAIKKRLTERWSERQYDRQYTQFIDCAFRALNVMQQRIDILNFSIKDMALMLIVQIKKSYAAIH